MVKNPRANAEDFRDTVREDPLEEGMAAHSSILAWRIPWTEEQRVGHDLKQLGTQHIQGADCIQHVKLQLAP